MRTCPQEKNTAASKKDAEIFPIKLEDGSMVLGNVVNTNHRRNPEDTAYSQTAYIKGVIHFGTHKYTLEEASSGY